jgi:crotonobetainyl-CoA:carnitine CoA-transferase CaiB-like acyl-CoA transferase
MNMTSNYNDPTAHAALDELLALANLPAVTARHARILGSEPVLPTRYRVGTAGAAALAAVGLAAAELWRLRTGRQQEVEVPMRAAAISLRSGRYMRIDGRPAKTEWDPIMGFYPARDGRWVMLHTNFANLRAAAARVLGTPEEPRAVAEAVRSWDAEALETALHEGGACGAFARTHAEWAGHPQADAIRDLPVVEIIRIGDAPPRPLPAGPRPLSGVRVLDLTRVLAGPTCARTLAEHGADVLKITRADLPRLGEQDLDTGIGKLSAHLDLRDPGQAEILRELVRGADVFSQSYRPGTLAARGFGPTTLAELRPGIVYVTLSAWSHDGPWRNRRGYDTIVQTTTGIAHASGGDGKPRHTPCSAIDYVSGNLMAFGTLVALMRRATIGGSWLVRVSLATTGRWIVDRGTFTAGQIAAVADELPADEIARLCTEVDAPSGRVRYLAPVVRMSETTPTWERPPVPLGYHQPVWPDCLP